VSVYVQAPDAQSAQKVAQSTVRAVRSYVRGLSKAKTSGGQVVQKVKITQLGLVNGGTVTSTPNRTVAIASAVVTWIVLCVLIALFSRTRRRMRARSEAEERAAVAGEPLPPAPPIRYPGDDAHTPPAPVHSRVD
jgi:branched-subunit amino acid ABC-type transport system permease component